MRYGIIADIHANLDAFAAVLSDIRQRGGVDEVWCLGDVVGYGAEPRECISLLRETTDVCVAGNHDRAATGKLSTADFNPAAAAACQWTGQQLIPEDVEYLNNLPQVIERGDFTLVHGSPRAPILEYILSTGTARENFTYFKTAYCLVGHSHQPMVFSYSRTGNCTVSLFPIDSWLTPGDSRLIINPGGVGQPRDGDPRASYAIYDSDSKNIRLHRVEYDINATQTKMTAQGLPRQLVTRLSYGM